MTKRRSKGGRPRKAGARYPNGKLKPMKAEPNAKVIEQRERLLGPLGALEKGDHPMDVALARRWITEAQHRAGMAYARLYRQAQIGAPGLQASRNMESPAEPIDVQAKGMQDWTDEEMTTVFDAVFNRLPPAGRAEAANAKLRDLHALLTPEERAEVAQCFVHADFPNWINQRVAGRFETAWERRRDILVRGLDTIAAKLKPTAKDHSPDVGNMIPFSAMTPVEPRHGPKREEVTRYVSPEGELIREVVVKRRVTTHEA